MSQMRIGLVGWLGRGNAGDDAMAAAFVTSIRRVAPEAEFVALADSSTIGGELGDLGVKGKTLFNAVTALPMVRSVLTNVLYFRDFACEGLSAIIIGGGSLFRYRSVIRSYSRVIAAARAKNPDIRIMIVGVSIGPFEDESAEKCCAEVLGAVDFALVRDVRSLQIAKRLAPALKAESYPDVALAYAAAGMDRYLRSRHLHTCDDKESSMLDIAVCLRAGEREGDQSKIVDWLSDGSSGSRRLTFIAMSNNPKYDDDAFARSLSSCVSHLDVRYVPYRGRPRETLVALAACDMVIAVRLHALIFAVSLRKPVLFYPYQAKLRDFSDEVSLSSVRLLQQESVDQGVLSAMRAPSSADEGKAQALVQRSKLGLERLVSELSYCLRR